MRTRVLLGLGVGLAVGLLIPVPVTEAVVRLLVGFIAGALVFLVPLLVTILRVDGPRTEAYVDGLDATVSETDVVGLTAALGGLAGVGVMLLTPAAAPDRLFEALLAIGAVVCGWLLLHTMYTLRYARHWYNAQPGCVDFDADAPPRFSDFAYLSFTLGMTYQVSDTDLKTPEIRRIVLFHTLQSYVFGTGVIAVTINLIAGLVR